MTRRHSNLFDAPLQAILAVALALAPGIAIAQTPPPASFLSHGRGTFGGERVDYTVRSGETIVDMGPGKPAARMFTVAYTRTGVKDTAHRPVTFLFNGGPGSSSIWLHVGSFGPKRVRLPDGAEPIGVAPYAIEANPSSLLDVTDLVFIDPVGAGFSEAIPASENPRFANLIDDAQSFARFIGDWLIANGRANSPKYLLGESYGSVRAPLILRNLAAGDYAKVSFNGLILLGQDMDTTETQQSAGNDMPYVIYLPTYAMTAWQHGKIDRAGRSLEQIYAEASTFARTDYAAALFQGSSLPAAERMRIAVRMSALIGLPASLIANEDLRIGTAMFSRELLKDEHRLLIRSDTRFTAPATEAANDRVPLGGDPPGLREAITAAGNSYLRGELGITLPRPYRVVAGGDWDYTLPDRANPQQTYHNVAPYVTAAMRDNPAMRMFVGSGYFDMLAAPLSAERTVNHSGLPRERITVRNYPVGHMIFISKPSLVALSADLRRFIRGDGE